MSDPLQPVQPGEPFRPSAATWNAMLAAAKAEKVRQALGASPLGQFRQGDLIAVLNDTGSDLERYAVVSLTAPLFSPVDDLDAFLRGVSFWGGVPASGDEGKFAILDEPAKDGSLVRAFVAGVCAVKVDITDPAHTCAEAGSGVTSGLVSSSSGSAQILWREGLTEYGYGYDTGLQWAIVRFGTACSGGAY